MSKNKKHKNKNKHKGNKRHEDAEYILGVIKSLGKDAGLKHLFPKVLRKMSQEEIVLALNKLEHQGKIQLEQKGKITLLQRDKPHKAHQRESEYLFGVADVTQSGIAFVTVDEMDKDVFIPKKFTGNAMQGDVHCAGGAYISCSYYRYFHKYDLVKMKYSRCKINPFVQPR